MIFIPLTFVCHGVQIQNANNNNNLYQDGRHGGPPPLPPSISNIKQSHASHCEPTFHRDILGLHQARITMSNNPHVTTAAALYWYKW